MYTTWFIIFCVILVEAGFMTASVKGVPIEVEYYQPSTTYPVVFKCRLYVGPSMRCVHEKEKGK